MGPGDSPGKLIRSRVTFDVFPGINPKHTRQTVRLDRRCLVFLSVNRFVCRFSATFRVMRASKNLASELDSYKRARSWSYDQNTGLARAAHWIGSTLLGKLCGAPPLHACRWVGGHVCPTNTPSRSQRRRCSARLGELFGKPWLWWSSRNEKTSCFLDPLRALVARDPRRVFWRR